MQERTTRKSVTFLHPFSLAGVDEKLEAGTYVVETLEEAIEGLSFIAYRRVSTTIEIAAKGYGQAARQVIAIDPRDLEAAQELDANGSDRDGIARSGLQSDPRHEHPRHQGADGRHQGVRQSTGPTPVPTTLLNIPPRVSTRPRP